jgi:hypothetical protein
MLRVAERRSCDLWIIRLQSSTAWTDCLKKQEKELNTIRFNQELQSTQKKNEIQNEHAF